MPTRALSHCNWARSPHQHPNLLTDAKAAALFVEKLHGELQHVAHVRTHREPARYSWMASASHYKRIVPYGSWTLCAVGYAEEQAHAEHVPERTRPVVCGSVAHIKTTHGKLNRVMDVDTIVRNRAMPY